MKSFVLTCLILWSTSGCLELNFEEVNSPCTTSEDCPFDWECLQKQCIAPETPEDLIPNATADAGLPHSPEQETDAGHTAVTETTDAGQAPVTETTDAGQAAVTETTDAGHSVVTEVTDAGPSTDPTESDAGANKQRVKQAAGGAAKRWKAGSSKHC